MVAFVFGIVLLVAGIVAGIVMCLYKEHSSIRKFVDSDGTVHSEQSYAWDRKEVIETVKTKPLAKFSAIPFVAGGVLFLVLLIVSVLATVPAGHTGIQTNFGKVSDDVLDAGIHTKSPWTKVTCMDNRVQKATLNMPSFSSDIQEVNVTYTVNYQIRKQNAQEIFKTIGVDYYNTVVSPTIAESVKTIVAQYTAESLISNRDELAHRIEELLNNQLDKYNIVVVSTAIENMDFTDEFTNAVEAKQVAVQNKLKAQTEQEQKTMEAEQQAERSKIQATANAEIARIQAEADKAVAEIGADSAEYQGKKEAAIALQRLASINGWTVVPNEQGLNELIKADGNKVTAEELKVGTIRLIEYYYVTQWDGELPKTMLGDADIMAMFGLEE